jgi:hypothetical protein
VNIIFVNPLQGPVDIKLFNEQWFDGNVPTEYPVFVPVYIPLPYQYDPPQYQQAASNVNTEVEENEPLHLMHAFEELYHAFRYSRDKLFFQPVCCC